jgi:hypothetical protein
MRLEATIQRRGLEEYVERFQTVDAALTLAGVNISDERKVITFLKGLREREDRRFVISHRPANLKEAYQAVVALRQVHVLSSSPAPWDKPRERKLQLARRQREESLPRPSDPKAGPG